jgi:hypothetical protein
MNADGKTDKEAPAKVWQYEQLFNLNQDVKSELSDINRKLDEIPRTFLTREQHQAAIELLREQFNTKVELIHAEYRPMKKNLNRIGWAVGSVLIVAAVQLLLNLYRGTLGTP